MNKNRLLIITSLLSVTALGICFALQTKDLSEYSKELKKDESDPYSLTINKANTAYSYEESMFGAGGKLATHTALGNELVLTCGGYYEHETALGTFKNESSGGPFGAVPWMISVDQIIQDMIYFTIDADKSVVITLSYFNLEEGGYCPDDKNKTITVEPGQVISGDDMKVEAGFNDMELSKWVKHGDYYANQLYIGPVDQSGNSEQTVINSFTIKYLCS